MGGYSITDPTYQALSSSDDDPRAMLAKIMSPSSAAQLVGPPPDSPPAHQPGVSTPLTGTLAAAPSQAVAKNMDTASGRQAYNTPQQSPIGGLATGVSNPPNGGDVNSIVNPVQPAPIAARTAVQPANTGRFGVQQVQPAVSPTNMGLPPAVTPAPYQPGVPLAAQQAQRLRSYSSGPGPAMYAASQSPVSTDPRNPDPSASLRPAGSSVAGPQPVSPAAPTQVQGPSALDTAQSRLAQLTNSGSGVSQIQNPFLRGLARTADVAGSILAPGVAAAIPGTTLHNQQLIGRQQQIVGNDQAQQTVAAQQQDIQQQTAQRAATAAKETAMAGADTPRPVTAQEAVQAGTPGLEGSIMRPSDIGRLNQRTVQNQGQIDKQDDPDSVAAKNAQSLADVRQTQQVLNKAKADAANADPSTPAGRMVIAKLRAAEDGHSAAMVRAQAQMINAQAGAFGTVNGQALPGAMLTDQGQPVGSHFQSNVRPTGAERGKGDLATSARKEIGTMQAIAEKHPEYIGPGYGQSQQFQKWIGSQDPDAQRFATAKAIAGEHAAAMFGSHSKEVIQQIDSALGSFRDNPAAAKAAMGEVLGATGVFAKAGTMKTVGSNVAAQAVPQRDPTMLYARDPGGKLHASPKEGAKPLPAGWKYDVQPAGGK
jgi:hypothetical protein